MIAADATPLCPLPHLLRDPAPSSEGAPPEVPASLAADDPELLARAPSATVRALARGQRERPPARRETFTHALRITGPGGAHKLHITVGHRPDGTVREFRVDVAHVVGAPFRALGIIVAAQGSLALQHGASLREVCDALRAAYFEPSGVVSGHPTITHADSLFDLVAQVLEDEDAVLREELARKRAERSGT